ncbi:hypothetical protein C8F04DRAFT_1075783 [Mycena alexandri]|uniref:Mid2 domain-containing protein n=1 Tax=Mycena alexandri TaxID=1745969 RepID=A0AAD6TA90_9AGAR|nr:hypothetical protein C8F04DRAFT_1075783 [Mycena alexandri]
MLINPQNLSLTLFVSLLLTVAVDANDFAHPNRRAHDDLKRLVKKRSPFPQTGGTDGGLLGGIANFVGDPNSASAAGNSASAAASASATASDSAAGVSAASQSDSASASAASVSASSASTSQSASISQSASAVSTSSTPAAPSVPPPTPTPPPNTPIANDDTAPKSRSTVTNTATLSVLGAASTSPPTRQEAATKTKITITTVLIVVAASVGGVAILWTVFRKWKLGHSSKFDERMAPIDWQPTNDDVGIVPAHRRTNSRASSFNSSQNHNNSAGAGVYRDQLNHDFTAAPANLAPVGGYADLARGPSPQPQMQEALGRGPSMRSYNDGRGPTAYDTGVPLHHQAGYGAPAPVPDAYDYNGDAVRF